MTSRIKALNEELYRDFQSNKKVTISSILTFTKLRRELRKQINENKCSWCDCNIENLEIQTAELNI